MVKLLSDYGVLSVKVIIPVIASEKVEFLAIDWLTAIPATSEVLEAVTDVPVTLCRAIPLIVLPLKLPVPDVGKVVTNVTVCKLLVGVESKLTATTLVTAPLEVLRAVSAAAKFEALSSTLIDAMLANASAVPKALPTKTWRPRFVTPVPGSAILLVLLYG